MFRKSFLLIALLFSYSSAIQTSFKTIAIPADQFCKGNSLVIYSLNSDGEELTSRVDLSENRTQFSQQEIDDCDIPNIDEKQAVVAQVNHAEVASENSKLVILYFEVDASVNFVRALVVKNTLLEETPFYIMELSFDSEDDEEGDPFGDNSVDEFNSIDFKNVKQADPVQLTWYDALALQARLLWAYQSQIAQRKMEAASDWVSSVWSR